MSAFFELRIYQIAPGKMNEWVSFMEKTCLLYTSDAADAVIV